MNILKQISLKLRLIRLERFITSLIYTFQRDWADRQYQSSQKVQPLTTPGRLLTVEKTRKGAQFSFEKAQVEIEFLSPELVRVNWEPGLAPVPYGIVQQDWPEVALQLEDTEQGKIISSDRLKVIIKPEGGIEFQDANGRVLRQELPPQRRGEAWQQEALLRSPEQIYGLGERAAPFNLRASDNPKYRMWHYDAGGKYGPGSDPLYLCIPVYMGLHDNGSYLVFYENSFSATFTLGDSAVAAFSGGALRYYFIGAEPAKAITLYTELTGRPPLPPRWAFGYHQSRWGYETEAAVRETAQGFQEHNLPLSAIHLDIDCKDNFRSFTIDPDRFPKLREFNQEMAEQGVNMVAIVNPGVKRDRRSQLYREGVSQDIFCKLPNGNIVHAPVWPGMSAFPDFTHPLARHWWSRQYEYLLDMGIAGFWHDMNDPGVFALWGDATLPKATQHFMEGRGGIHLEAHNLYGFQQARAGYEALREYQPSRRPFIVSRSGWAGLQRYAWTWTGDVETSWGGLGQTLPTVLGMGLSGIPYTGPDIGGFKGNPSAELYLRWFQLSTFLPFCRTHSANNVKPRTPWSYGIRVLDCVRSLLQLRYQLIPYFYTLAWEATQKGYPPVRPVFWSEPENPDLWGVDDAFFLGDALLVYPIVKDKARSRSALFPRGQWYKFTDDTMLEGSQRLTLEVPLEEIPLFVKAGTVLPMEQGGHLTLHLYPPTDGNSTGWLYSDAGDGYGESRLDRIHLERTADGLAIAWESQGDYPFPYSSVELQIHGMAVQQVWVDGTEVEFQQPREQPRTAMRIAPGVTIPGDNVTRVQIQGKFRHPDPTSSFNSWHSYPTNGL
ncbi:glycoside hydrolase family 31 protein [Oscillatoria sp. HE19RPO]|uniref:glycoside hydrolase family 31 protein n=1 Tax=Oscillatoria sp. HE19RPO TaxID=2954806 RepID=UPI0020C2505E|nr:glycoside hydrolase family 31 protein [Oscillatoria sp. HE19RPO]